MSIQVLRERRDALAKSLHELVDNNPGEKWAADTKNAEKYDASLKEVDDIDAEIGRITALQEKFRADRVDESLVEASARQNHGKPTSVSVRERWLRHGDNAVTAAEWADIRATMSTTTDTEGGFTVQTDVAKKIADALAAFGGVRSVATVLPTAQGNPMSFPASDGTAETGEQISENTTATADDIAFTAIALNTYKYSSKVVAVPFELLQDSAVDIEAFVDTRLITRIGRITNTKFTTGTGSSEPRGVVTASSVGKTGTTGQTTTVIFDDLVDLFHSVDPAYRNLGRMGFMMNDSTLKVVRKLKDDQSRPVFMPGYEGLGGAMGDRLLGLPITVNQDMAVMAANAKSILCGDFSFYNVRDVMGATMFRFSDSAYVKLGQVGFLMWSRHGGNLIDAGGAVKHYANSAT